MYKQMLIVVGIYLFALLVSSASFGYGGGSDHSLGFSLISASPSQDDLNTLIERANSTNGGISTSKFGSGLEFAAHYMYRFPGSIFGILFRPSYFSQSTKGSGTGGDYNYSLSGWSFFPVLRLYPLENSFIKFFMQIGLGYGQLSGSITEAAASVSFKGSDFGAMGGIGSEFCFTDAHCMVIEGSFRYLPYQRNLPSSKSGTSSSWDASGKEVQIDNGDLQTTMTGVLATLGYTYYF